MADPSGVEREAIWDQEWQATLLEAALEKVEAQVEAKQAKKSMYQKANLDGAAH